MNDVHVVLGTGAIGLALIDELAGLDEMLYEFTQPFVVDGAKAQSRLGVAPTPMADAITATVDWFRDRHRAAGLRPAG